jgi:transcriptional/translational regulatory protein YebC/TACO1
MNAKAKVPKISNKVAAEIADAARKAYANPDMDKFMDEVFEEARKFQQRRRERGEEVRTE